ncbi:carboxylesterase family protein [Streptomyces gobiensis]|uniref:carboxylesterase family protein n=1 Tax=Streptomyces gobiensis TaxID=2875706 RepID=UPI001E547D6B|nr:carboxylesterase family protein [Streptomyces gobiensis]UGY92912.1 carboxylesterase family protein [Streptomyces gobiensis]
MLTTAAKVRKAALGTIAAVLMAATLVAAARTTGGGDPDPSVVRSDQGAIRGTVTDDARIFQGIPYAAPPTGPLRWRSPQPAANWSGVRDGTAPGPPCPPSSGGDEDCLYLNVSTPRNVSVGANRPITVWLRDTSPPAAEGGTILVTANHRQGPLGYLAHPSLKDSGNFGLEDQQAVLRWVQRNAKAFGGDPSDVTLVGECAQLAAPGSGYLFRRAIVRGGSCADEAAHRTRKEALRDGTALAERLGCTGPSAADCLRRISPAALAKADDTPYGPVYGTPQLPSP